MEKTIDYYPNLRIKVFYNVLSKEEKSSPEWKVSWMKAPLTLRRSHFDSHTNQLRCEYYRLIMKRKDWPISKTGYMKIFAITLHISRSPIEFLED